MNNEDKNLLPLYPITQPTEVVYSNGVGVVEPISLDGADKLSTLAVSEFVDWAAKNVAFLERGRMFGFEIAVSAQVKDAIALALDRETAFRINASLSDFHRRT